MPSADTVGRVLAGTALEEQRALLAALGRQAWRAKAIQSLAALSAAEVSALIPLAMPLGRAGGPDLEIRPSTGTAVNLPAVEVTNSSTLLPEMWNSCEGRGGWRDSRRMA